MFTEEQKEAIEKASTKESSDSTPDLWKEYWEQKLEGKFAKPPETRPISAFPKVPGWVGRIHAAIHTSGRKFVLIDKEKYPVQFTGTNKIPFIVKGEFTYLKQNPHTESKWAQHARDGLKVTQITVGSQSRIKYYGVILEDICVRYGPQRIVGQL